VIGETNTHYMKLLNALTQKTPAAVLSTLLLFCLFTSCKKASSVSGTETISEATAADAITQSVSAESGGMSAQSSDAIVVTSTQAFLLPCGEQHDSTIAAASGTGIGFTYSYNFAWNWTLSCENGLPKSIVYHLTGTSSYDDPRISFNANSTGTFEVTDLLPPDDEYAMTATYTRTGETHSKVLNENSFTSTITINSSDIKIDKITREISSGTASVSITGTSFRGVAFTFTGTLTFLGNKKATLKMASGNEYQIAW